MRDPSATYEQVRDRAITPQPEYLAAYREARRRPYVPPEPDPAHHVINGKTGESHAVAKGVTAEPAVKGVRRTRRQWCSVCLRYLTQAEKRDQSHACSTAARPQPQQRRKRKPKRQWWKSEGLAGSYSIQAPDPRAKKLS